MEITEEVEIPQKGLYDLIFTKEGYLKGGRYDHHAPQDCTKPTGSKNECPTCGEAYYDFTDDEGEGII